MAKSVRYTLFVLVAMLSALLVGCSTGKRVVRGDQGTVINGKTTPVTPNKPVTHPPLPKEKHQKRLLDEAYGWLGTPYVYGGKSKSGADCSGFVMMAYKNALGIDLPRRSCDQADFCKRVKAVDMVPGDLIFFNTSGDDRTKVTHVGMYIGDGKMIHASSKKGVIIVDLSQKYYVDNFLFCGKVESYRKLLK